MMTMVPQTPASASVRRRLLLPLRFAPVAAIALRQYFLIRGSFARIVPLFVWAAIDIVLWGFLTRYLTDVFPGGFNAVGALLGATLLWNMLVRIMQGVSTPFLEDVWTRDFLTVFAAPLSLSEYIAGLVLASVFTSVIGVSVMVLTALPFGFSVFSLGVALAPFVLVLFLFGVALGIAGSSIVLRFGPSAEWFIWPIPALVSPFVGVLYPPSVLPAWMQAVGRVLPPTYVFEGMRAVIHGGSVQGAPLLLAVGLAAVWILLASLLFRTVFRYVLRSGLLARYSAESAG